MPVNLYKAPAVIQTEKGLSVFYRERFLYSKRDPGRNISALVESLAIPPSTLVVCFSPVLGYSLKDLLKKLSPCSYLLSIECDPQLDLVFHDYADKSLFEDKRFSYICTTSIPAIVTYIQNWAGIKKVISLEGSAAVRLYGDFYSKVLFFLQEAVSRFWINHITLINLGRNYAKNIFRNYKYASTAQNICRLKKASIKKPVLVVGAGPSLDLSRNFILKNRNRIFILAVDAALPAIAATTMPDAVVLLESQFWIQQSFIGFTNSKLPIYADITANTNAVKALGGNIFFFFTEYSKSLFLKKLANKGILPESFTPMGSIGLTALQLALFLSDDNMPIFHTGLDFAWGKGYTHSKESSQVKALLNTSEKLHTHYTPDSVFPAGYSKVKGKNSQHLTITPNLKSYAELYRYTFASNCRIYDIGKIGINISENTITEKQVEELLSFHQNNLPDNQCECEKESPHIKSSIKYFLDAEKQLLLNLREILIGTDKTDEKTLIKILKECSYLYMHFPDSISPEYLNTAFLKRVRIELEYFLKNFG